MTRSRAVCLLGQELQARKVWVMSAELPEPGPEGPQRSPGSGGHSGASGSGQCPPSPTPAPWSLPRWRAYVAAAVLCYINLLNYMNWFIIAGEEGDRHPGQPCPSTHWLSCQLSACEASYPCCLHPWPCQPSFPVQPQIKSVHIGGWVGG